MFQNQKGFTVFEAVIIIVALVAIGAAGYFAYQARQDKTDYSVSVPKKSQTSSKDSKSSGKPQVANKPPANCYVPPSYDVVAVFLTLGDTQPDHDCIVMKKTANLGVENGGSKNFSVQLGGKTIQVPSNSSAGFDGSVGSFLSTGQYSMKVSTYQTENYPTVWVVE